MPRMRVFRSIGTVMRERVVELVSGGLAVCLPGDRPAMLRGLSLRHDGPAVLIVDEAISRP